MRVMCPVLIVMTMRKYASSGDWSAFKWVKGLKGGIGEEGWKICYGGLGRGGLSGEKEYQVKRSL